MAQRKMRLLKFVLVMLAICPPLWGQINHRTVHASGTGTTLNNAINDALSEAIARVNGKSVETQTQLQSVEVSAVDQDSSSYFASEAFQQAVKSATRGAVSGYELISQDQTEGLWEVEVKATVAEYKRSKSANRRRIAVAPLRLSGGSFMIDGRLIDKEQSSRMMGQALVAQLVQSRKFTVLDREFIAETVGEKSMLLHGDVPVEEMAKLGQELFADYMLVGTLEGINFKTTTRKLSTSNREISIRQGTVAFGYRIIDVPTRQIKFADVATINLSESELRAVGPLGSQPDIQSAMISAATDKISKEILDAIYPMLVIAVRGDQVTLNQGGEMLKVGDKYEVYRYGEKIIDPYTKESLGREEHYSATIQITRVNPKASYAKIISSEVDLASVFHPKSLVCRAPSQTESAASEEIKRIQEKQKKRRESREDDW